LKIYFKSACGGSCGEAAQTVSGSIPLISTNLRGRQKRLLLFYAIIPLTLLKTYFKIRLRRIVRRGRTNGQRFDPAYLHQH
jgi:hypothetical protein